MAAAARSLLVWSAVLAAATAAHGALPCEESGFCSESNVTHFFGDISTAEGFKALLKARSYKKEVIFFAGSVPRLDVNLASVRSLERLGLYNYFFMATDESTCAAIVRLANVSCGYYGEPSEEFPVAGVFYMWSLRYRTIVRAARLGYNVMMADGDSFFFHDPYKFFKNPVLADFNVMNMCETDDQPYCGASNGGVLYFQNCRPDGPALWMLNEAIERPLRYMDNHAWLKVHPYLGMNFLTMDQDGLNAALDDAFKGKTLHKQSLEFCYRSGDAKCRTPNPRREAIKRAMDAEPVASTTWVLETRKVPEDWRVLVGNDTAQLYWRHMHVPVAPSHPTLQGLGYPGPRAGAAAMVRDQLTRDCPSCPWWPEPEDPAGRKRAAAVPLEKFLYAPMWLFYSYPAWGHQGWWDAKLAPVVREVFGHTHTILSGTGGKRQLAMQLGFYDFSLVRHPEASVFGLRPYYCCEGEAPKVLALHPDADLSWLRSPADLQRVLVGMQAVAKLSGRVVVWPDVPCLDWMRRSNERPVANMSSGSPQPPFWYSFEVQPYMAAQGLRCFLARAAAHECCEHHTGMHSLEFEELQRHIGPAALPSASTVVALETSEAAAAMTLASVSASRVKQVLNTWTSTQVVYLRAPVTVDLWTVDQTDQAALEADLLKCFLTNTNPGRGFDRFLHTMPEH